VQALDELRVKFLEHYESGGESAPVDIPGTQNSGAQGNEYPTRLCSEMTGVQCVRKNEVRLGWLALAP
jgi:hypothetical protein